MKENENQEPSNMAGAAKGGTTSKKNVGSAVSAAVGEPVAITDDPVLSALQGILEQIEGSGFSQSLTRRGNSEVWAFSEIAQKRIDTARAAIAALPVSTAEQPDDLPRLPAPTRLHYGLHYRADDMEAYARDAVDMALARQSRAKPVEQASKITDGDSARSFVAQWHRDHFPTDRTFTNYIMGRNRHCALAGDFAWQLAKALESLDARLAAPTQVSAPQAEVLIREAREVFDLMLDGCNEQEFGDFQNGHGETIGKRMDALHARLRTFPGATRAGAPQAGQEAQAVSKGWSIEKRQHPGGVFCIVGDGRSMRAITEDAEPTLYRYFADAIATSSTSGAPAAPDEVRNAALEEAAKICDAVNNYDNPMTARDCADTIRALRTTTATGADSPKGDA